MTDLAAPRFDAILFDLDGTLLDSIALILDSYRHTLAHHRMPPRPDAEILGGLGTTLEAQFAQWVAEPAEVPRLVETYVAHNLAVHDASVRAYPGVSELVRGLHGRRLPLGVVTSKRRRGAERGLAALALTECFATVVSADDVARPKPDPEPVRRALDALGVPAARAVFIGDATHDVLAGRAAGVRTVAVTWGAGARADLEAVGADHVVSDAEGLAAVL